MKKLRRCDQSVPIQIGGGIEVVSAAIGELEQVGESVSVRVTFGWRGLDRERYFVRVVALQSVFVAGGDGAELGCADREIFEGGFDLVAHIDRLGEVLALKAVVDAEAYRAGAPAWISRRFDGPVLGNRGGSH